MCIIIFYNILQFLLFPIFVINLLIRLCIGKENIESFKNRFSIFQFKRPQGKLIWLNAASVGESRIALTIIKAMQEKQQQNLFFLITTGTVSSTNILAQSLPSNTYHLFAPIDNFLIVKIFLYKIKPDLGIFIESELWPSLINQASKTCKLLLFNARLSDRSYKRWQKLQWLFDFMMHKFHSILVQSRRDLEKFNSLGCQDAVLAGNIKFSSSKLGTDTKVIKNIKNILKDKVIFVAASTHIEDEKVLIPIIKKLNHENLNYYPIIIQRHPERKQELIKLCQEQNLKYSCYSDSNTPTIGSDLYIIDSFGQMGNFYELASIVFIGGSFANGGHNLLEAAHFKNLIIVGSDMSNFQNITDEMLSIKSVIQVKNANELEQNIIYYVNNIHELNVQKFMQNASIFVENKQNILNIYLSVIKNILI